MARLFVTVDTDDPDRATLDADGLRHLRALRLDVGDPFEAIVGPGAVRAATVESMGRKDAAARLGAEVAVGGVDPSGEVVLAIALADLPRLDTVVEKATELGATRIVPLRAARSQLDAVSASRRARWERIARSACEQCGRTVPPSISDVTTVETACGALPAGAECFVFTPEATEPFDGGSANASAVVLFVGPEGGFTSAEVDLLRGAGAIARSLGPRILRFETAAAAALSRVTLRG